MLSYLSSVPISVLRSLNTEANKFYNRTNRLYGSALLTRCYTHHAFRPVIDSDLFECPVMLMTLILVIRF